MKKLIGIFLFVMSCNAMQDRNHLDSYEIKQPSSTENCVKQGLVVFYEYMADMRAFCFCDLRTQRENRLDIDDEGSDDIRNTSIL